MKLNYIIPDGAHYQFFREIIPALNEAGIEVGINAGLFGPKKWDADMVLVGILPCTPGQIEMVEEYIKLRIPVILWHWDLFSFVDFREERWRRFLSMLPQAADIWSCSYETARVLKEKKGLDSYMIPAWVNVEEISKPVDNPFHKPFVFYASSGSSFGKRIDWAHKACDLLGYTLNNPKHQELSRLDYVRSLQHCRCYLITAFEESNGSIPAMEAMALGKQVVCADIPSNREVFANDAIYFKNDDFGSLLDALRKAWNTGDDAVIKTRIRNLFSLTNVSNRIIHRLDEVWQARACKAARASK